METQQEQPEKNDQFQNEHVRVVVHEKPKCRIEFEVEASKALVQEARRKAFREIAKQVSLPGFRKGRAPDELILKKYPSDVDRAWQEAIADAAFRESIKLTKI